MFIKKDYHFCLNLQDFSLDINDLSIIWFVNNFHLSMFIICFLETFTFGIYYNHYDFEFFIRIILFKKIYNSFIDIKLGFFQIKISFSLLKYFIKKEFNFINEKYEDDFDYFMKTKGIKLYD